VWESLPEWSGGGGWRFGFARDYTERGSSLVLSKSYEYMIAGIGKNYRAKVLVTMTKL